MRWNWLWFAPLALVCLSFSIFDGIQAYLLGADVLRNWSWVILISPSAYLWLGVTINTVVLPVNPLFAIPTFFATGGEESQHPYFRTFISLFVSGLVLALCWFIGWGSYPLASDDKGLLHFRMIPFVPLPTYGFF